MYAVKIYYTDTDGDNELEVNLVRSKKEALQMKEAYECSSSKLREAVPELSYLNKIEIEKQSNFNYIESEWLLCSILIVIIPILIIKVFFGDYQKKYENEVYQVSDSSNYIAQELNIESGKKYDVTVVSSFCANLYRYNKCFLVVEYSNAQGYLYIDGRGKKGRSSALNIQKMKVGEKYTIYKEDGIICVK